MNNKYLSKYNVKFDKIYDQIKLTYIFFSKHIPTCDTNIVNYFCSCFIEIHNLFDYINFE
jgi:hypothetical protein